MFFCLAINAQSTISIQPDTVKHNEISAAETQEVKTQNQINLKPVYFNLKKHILKYNGTEKISEADFLQLCRSINDSAIQVHVARYDAFKQDKLKLGYYATGSGVSAILLLVTANEFNQQNNNTVSGSFSFLGALAIAAIPACAIYSRVPHKKRKAVVFRDLPIVYNRYVESLYANN